MTWRVGVTCLHPFTSRNNLSAATFGASLILQSSACHVDRLPSFTIARALTQKRRPSRQIRHRHSGPGPGACPRYHIRERCRIRASTTSSSPCPRSPLCSVAPCAYVPSPKRSTSPRHSRRWLDSHKEGVRGTSAPTPPHLVMVHLGLVCVRDFSPVACGAPRRHAPLTLPCRRLHPITSVSDGITTVVMASALYLGPRGAHHHSQS